MEQVEYLVSQYRRLQYDYSVLSKIKILYRLIQLDFHLWYYGNIIHKLTGHIILPSKDEIIKIYS